MAQAVFQVDAFTGEPFRGNPAAVVPLERERDESWMQAVAREMNLSETAFLHAAADGFRLRWFTPAVEVELCGHATLASAHTLWETGRADAAVPLRFHTRSGLLTAVRDGEWIELDFPATPASPAEAPPGLLEALGAEAVEVGRSRFDYLVRVGSADVVRSLRPDFGKLRQVEARGVIVTAESDDGEHDFVSRFFAPFAGVDEDPVTGSAHCCLSPFWTARLGRETLAGYQASARGGTVRVRLAGDRVRLRGRAITIMRGVLVED
jgi:predicted PhzF superfamily epimerase YddE/YHI9